MSTKEMQEKIVDTMRTWQKIEDASITSTSQIIQKTDNPLVRLVMEIIQSDSMMHRRVQGFVADTFEKQAPSLNPEELAGIWDAIEKHIVIEKKMVGFVQETLQATKGKKMLVQEYLLNYLLQDEKKHDELLNALSKIQKGLYPYAS